MQLPWVTCHVMSRHVTSCHVMYLMSRHGTSCHVMSYHVMSRHVTSCHILPRHVTSCHIALRHITSKFAGRSRDQRFIANWLFHTQSIQIKHDRVRWLSRRLPIQYRISGIWSSFIFIFIFFIHRSFSETTQPILTKFSGIVYSGVVWIIR